ncbi:NDR1/HIN1-like protein 13 [Quercus robur]|uniref:NDR1/HIN1-like protein 13 n=1 Tax=Quercus robur TaxID=38942 RepID=UPI0021632C22|nr:NDR1/HIN1-like protein 13 [Quercus robur]
MEGRVPPAPDGDDTDDNSLPLHSSGSKSLPPPPPSPLLITPPPDMNSETYVIQIPKDQIYRIPPPENALFVERNGKKPVEKNKKSRPQCWVWITGSILVVLALIIALILVTLSIVYRSKSPSFSVAHVLVKYAQNSTHKHSQSAGYTISLKANNPNEIMGIDYDSGGVVTLSSEGKKIATGKFPSLEQEENGFKKIKVFLKGTKETLPKEIEKSMKANKTKVPVSLTLNAKLRVKLKLGVIKTWILDMDVACKIKVNTLGVGSMILSEECQN